MHYSTLMSVALAAFTFTPSILAHAIPNPVDLDSPASNLAIRADEVGEVDAGEVDDDGPPLMGSNDEALSHYIEDPLKLIEDMPDSVLDAGEEAVRQWALAHGAGGSSPETAISETSDTTTLEKRNWQQVLKCAWAIGKAIVELKFPILKLRRVKALIKALGGAKKVAQMLLKAKSKKDLVKIGGAKLLELANIFFNVQEIKKECFRF